MEPSTALKHFVTLNRTRIARLRELSPLTQQAFFELLPLIFHINSTALPAYVSNHVPAGISDFQPNDADLDAAQKFNNSFTFKRRALRHYPIQGLYLINDHGGISYPEDAEFDLWLVHSDQLSNEEQAQIQQKLDAVQNWAKSLTITLNVRLFNVAELAQQPFSTYDLDRLYLNGLVLAGSLPLWWTISPEQEANYQQAAAQLSEKRRPSRNTFIDFGPLTTDIEAETLFNLSYQQLDSAMEQGLEPCLNIFYLQHCIDVYPHSHWLSHVFKEAVYQDERDPLQLDCNILKLRALSEHPSVSAKQLILAQQSLYVLFKERMSQKVALALYPWRREFCRKLIDLWYWSDEQLDKLDSRSQSRYRQCSAEYEQVRRILFEVGFSLFAFAKQQNLVIDEQQKQIQKKQQLHNTAPDIISCLPTALLPTNQEEHLYLHRASLDQGWAISEVPITQTSPEPLHHADSLLQVLAWTINNQLLSKSTRIKIADETEQVSINTVLQLVNQLLRSTVAEPAANISEKELNAPADLQQVIVIVNLEKSPTDNLSQQGLVRSSLQSDPLNYAFKRQSLVLTVEALAYTSWGQWQYISYQGLDSPLQLLASLLHWQPKNISDVSLSCWCPSETYGQAISNRILDLYFDVISHYQSFPEAGNFQLNISGQHYRLQWQSGRAIVNSYAKQSDLLQTLASTNTRFSNSKFDHSIDNAVLLNKLLQQQSPEQISLYIRFHQKIISIYIVDELGNIITHKFEGLTESTLLTHFYHFYRPLN